MLDANRLRTLIAFAIAITAPAMSCSRREAASKPAPTSPTSALEPAPSPAPAPRPPMPANKPAEVSRADASDVLRSWLDAQNGGDFARYSALYAERFQGVKRIGLRSQRYDQNGWLRDRQRMFEKPMHVEASDVAITTTASTAFVRFVQSWSSGSFEDRGPKAIQLVVTPAGLRIASEEMLASSVERSAAGSEFATPEISLVIHTLHTYVVLGTDAADELGEGPPVLDSKIASDVAARRAVPVDRLPAGPAGRRGAQVRLYGPSAVLCRARLGAPFLLRRMVAHFGTVQGWTADPAMDDDAVPSTPEQVASDTWDEASEKTLLVAELDDVRGDCSKALWARNDTLPDPIVFGEQPLTDDLRARTERAVRILPAYRAIAKDYEAFLGTHPGVGDGPHYWERFEGAEPLFRTFGNADHRFVTFAAEAGGCGDFGGSLWALFEVRGEALRLVNHPGREDEPGSLVIDAIVDADRDGRVEALAPSLGLRPSPKGPMLVRDITPPFHDCGC